jgi:hypothetical protein
MSATITIPILWLVFKYKNLFPTKLVYNSRFHQHSRQTRLSDLNAIVSGEEKNINQLNLLTDFVGQFFHDNVMPCFGAVLPTATFNNSVQGYLQKEPAF